MRPALARLLRLREQQALAARQELARHRDARHAVDAALGDLHGARARQTSHSVAELLHAESLAAHLGRSAALLAAEEPAVAARAEGAARASKQIERLVAGARAAAQKEAARREARAIDDWQRSRQEP